MSSSPLGSEFKKSGPLAILIIGTELLIQLVVIIFEHAILAWVSEGLGEELGVHSLGDAIRWCLEHSVAMFVMACVIYCVVVVIKAQLWKSRSVTSPILLTVSCGKPQK